MEPDAEIGGESVETAVACAMQQMLHQLGMPQSPGCDAKPQGADAPKTATEPGAQLDGAEPSGAGLAIVVPIPHG